MTGSRGSDSARASATRQEGSQPRGTGEYLAELDAAQAELRQKLPPLRAALKDAQRIVSRLRTEVHELDVRGSIGAGPATIDQNTKTFDEFDSLELQRFGEVDQSVLGLSEGLIELSSVHKGILAALRSVESAATAQARARAQIEVRLPAKPGMASDSDQTGARHVLVVKEAGYLIALPLECVNGVHREVVPGPATNDEDPAPDRASSDPKSASVKMNGHEYVRQTLGTVLGVPGFDGPMDSATSVTLVLVELDDERHAVQVDAVIREQFVQVKPVGWPLDRLNWITGAALLGDGQTAFVPKLKADRPQLEASRSAVAKARPETVPRDAPAPEPAREPEPVATRPESEAAQVPAEDAPARILVVDDSATVRKFTERLLTRHGMHVETARDGVDAIAKLEQAAPQVILLDIEMPRMNGFQFAAVMRQNPRFKNTPIIMISSRIAPKHQQVAGSLGVRKFLGKPYQEEELLAEIKKLLD